MIAIEQLNQPEHDRMMALFESKNGGSVYVYELTSARPAGLGISQYGRCIKELRESGHQIINVVPGEFRLSLIRHNVTYATSVDTFETLNQKLQSLAGDYEAAPSSAKQAILRKGTQLREVLDKLECLL